MDQVIAHLVRYLKKKKVEIGTHPTTTKTPVSEKRADKVVVAKTRERKKVIDTKKTEAVAEIGATPKPKPSKSLAKFARPLGWTELSYIPLTYNISEQTLLKKFPLKKKHPVEVLVLRFIYECRRGEG